MIQQFIRNPMSWMLLALLAAWLYGRAARRSRHRCEPDYERIEHRYYPRNDNAYD